MFEVTLILPMVDASLNSSRFDSYLDDWLRTHYNFISLGVGATELQSQLLVSEITLLRNQGLTD